jgi:hypothetical protein
MLLSEYIERTPQPHTRYNYPRVYMILLAAPHERLDDTKQVISLYQEALVLLESTVGKHNTDFCPCPSSAPKLD